MSEPLVRIHVHEHTGTLVLNRPQKRNALSRELIAELSQAFYDLHMERKVRAVVLTGAGDAFCAGLDLAEMYETRRSEGAHVQWHADAMQYKELIDAMLRFPKPIIAAVNGAAAAGGAGLVLASDIVLASRQATFGFPEPRRGIVAGLVVPLLVYRLAAGPAAMLLLTGRLVDAEETLRLGVAHELVSHDQLWARAVEVAGECARCAPEALQLTKRLLNETIGEQLETQLMAGAAASATSRTTDAAAEGLAAFAEKREPRWQ
jgi:enoyl-CoA hydratase/carnithine racemase